MFQHQLPRVVHLKFNEKQGLIMNGSTSAVRSQIVEVMCRSDHSIRITVMLREGLLALTVTLCCSYCSSVRTVFNLFVKQKLGSGLHHKNN